MDKVALGLRLSQAREDAGMTQESLGRAVGLDRTAITRLEKGERKLNVTELVKIASILGRPLAYFVSDPLPAVVSRRQDGAVAHATTRALDTELDQFSRDVQTLLNMGLLEASEFPYPRHTPRSHDEAEAMASASRDFVGIDDQPVAELGRACEKLGLYTLFAPLGDGGPDGGCVEVDSTSSQSVGAAVVNGDAPLGRRRMTLAHELGHWLSGDAYDVEASIDNERMINSFAIHFLAPRAGVVAAWNRYQHWTVRDRAIAVGASFRLSWSATLGQLRNLSLIEQDLFQNLTREEPRGGDFLRLEFRISDEMGSTYLSPGFSSAAVNGFASGRITAARAIELLRGTLEAGELPDRQPLSMEDLRRSFTDHD